ncbi:MAG: GGDEF domain-containing protein [Myxococcaceae bacterium]
MNAADLLAGMKRTVEQLAAFNEIAKALTSTLEVREVLGLVMQKVSELMRPNNWSLVLQDETGQLYFEICVGEGSEKLKDMRIRPGEGIVGTVFQTGTPRRVEDVEADPAFARRFDDASAFRTKSVLAVPLRSKGRTLGVIELVNGANARAFTEDDLSIVGGIADYAAIAIENARNFKRVQELTISDEHTGLFNARHLRSLLDMEVARASRFHHPLSLIFLDLDGFKQVNDTHGHLVGSALLREVGELLSAAIRGVDFAFRYGGDEFAVLLIETDAAAARVIGERVRDRFRERTFPGGAGLEIGLTASVGVATFPDDAGTAVELLGAADRAMYRVKAQGRNEVASAGEAPRR